MDIQFDCPRCGQNLAVDETGAGSTTDCPKCSHKIAIPSRSEMSLRSTSSTPTPVSPSSPPKAPIADPSQGAVSESTLAGWFTFFAVISFLAAALAIYLLFSENRIDNQQGAVLLPAGIGGGLFCLAVAKIIRCLHESSQRLQRIEKLLERKEP